jgi:hypothetical protein
MTSEELRGYVFANSFGLAEPPMRPIEEKTPGAGPWSGYKTGSPPSLVCVVGHLRDCVESVDADARWVGMRSFLCAVQAFQHMKMYAPHEHAGKARELLLAGLEFIGEGSADVPALAWVSSCCDRTDRP